MASYKNGLVLAAATATLCFPGLGDAEPREVQSLDGTWQIVLDPENVGRANTWHQEAAFSARSDRRDIEVLANQITQFLLAGIAVKVHERQTTS